MKWCSRWRAETDQREWSKMGECVLLSLAREDQRNLTCARLERHTPGYVTCIFEFKIHGHLSNLYTFSKIPSPHKSLFQPTCMEPFLCSEYKREQNKAYLTAFG